jgi:DNA adenine methylase
MRSPRKTFGGKSYLARRIVSLFPDHETYVETHFGGGSVLLNKPKSFREIAIDINADLIHFWRMLRDYHVDFRAIIEGTPYTETVFNLAKDRAIGDPDEWPLHRAVRNLIVNRFSRGGLGKHFAWSDRQRGGKPGDVNAWETIAESLPDIAERIKDLVLLDKDAYHAIRTYDAPSTLFYCDPPYLHATRTHTKAYDHEMTDRDHERLLAALLGCKGRVFISGYDSPLYRRMLAGWKLHTFNMANHSGQGRQKQRRIECLWENNPS